jgi:acetate kinase
MNILTVNTGSSSIRLCAFIEKNKVLTQVASSNVTPKEISSEKLLNEFLTGNNIENIHAVSHRVVHGGMRLIRTCLVNDDVEKEIERLSNLAPLHNPIALKWIRLCKTVIGLQIPQIAVFDTAFFSAMPETATTYALPKDICRKYEIRRYGFHGLAHRAMLERWKELNPNLKAGGGIISLQLGAGCSITAVEKGSPVDTSMGFSPLEGLVMATRSGNVDPGLIPYLQRTAGMSFSEVETMLNKYSGLLGVSGISSDMKILLESGNNDARMAISIYCYRVKKYIGSYMAALNGVNGILFGGGVGENAPVIRGTILENMQWCGIELDERANSSITGREGKISTEKSTIDVWVISVDEAALLAHEAVVLLENT